MADKDEIKKRLIRSLDTSTAKYIPAERLNEAADELIKKGSADRIILEELAKRATGDRTAFAKTDIDDINDILNQLDE